MVLDKENLAGVHIADLAQYGLVFEWMSYEAFDVPAAQKQPNGALWQFKGQELSDVLIGKMNPGPKAEYRIYKDGITHVIPGRYNALTTVPLYNAYMRELTEEVLLGDRKTLETRYATAALFDELDKELQKPKKVVADRVTETVRKYRPQVEDAVNAFSEALGADVFSRAHYGYQSGVENNQMENRPAGQGSNFELGEHGKSN
ncbi:hypothetical protein ABW20_dc0104452 [Dactylellina cionopaga]|nr:hypothetical protein ABW20_dc0104452 [Dactylellina cionopaga]